MKRIQIAAASNQWTIKMNPNAFSKSEPASTEKYQVPLEKSAQRGRLEIHLVIVKVIHMLFIFFRVFEGRPDLLAAGASLLF